MLDDDGLLHDAQNVAFFDNISGLGARFELPFLCAINGRDVDTAGDEVALRGLLDQLQRTLDSVVRMKEVFGVSTMIVVSQAFHNERALAIAAHEEMDAWAVSAPDVPNRSSRIRSWFRERAARVWMMLDLWLWGREPRFLGEPVAVPEVKGEK